MNIEQVETNVALLVDNFNKDEFVFDLLLAYGLPKATITLLKRGRHDLSKKEGTVILKRKVFFRTEETADLHETIDTLQKDPSTNRHIPRFIIVTDNVTMLAVDTKTDEKLDIQIKDLSKHYDFFLPWAGIEKHKQGSENPADRKAAEKMARLYDEILAENTINDDNKRHDLNVFLTRLLFCFFAEDTEIFENKLFTRSIASHTQIDGSDFDSYVDRLFDVLNTKERGSFPEYLQKFPYVNGGLFKEKHWIPKFTTRSRRTIIECGELNWSKINPDIFGSMMQAVVHPGERGSLGMHYTSVPNIMKVIEPLFLDELKEEFEKSIGNKNKLKKLLVRISKIKFFDPACGSGNFLIIAYKELRRLEIQLIKELGAFSFSNISLSSFYGIEIDDFAHEIAKLSLYLAEHQMNIEFKQELSNVSPTLPLKTSGNIRCGNATRIDWEDVCHKNQDDEIYILGNPPYLGFNERNEEQKTDMDIAVGKIGNIKRLDYISCWFIKSTDFITGINGRYALVSTNSICQGEQVSLIWPYIFSKQQEMYFAYTSFRWTNNAKNNAGVTCVIIGIRNQNSNHKFIFADNRKKLVQNISPYLIDGDSVIISQRTESISNLPKMELGSSGIDGGHLVLTPDERKEALRLSPMAERFIKPYIGGGDFINDIERYCLWIDDKDINEALSIPFIKDRIDKCREYRLTAGRDAKKAAAVPHRFFYRKYEDKEGVILPMTSSEKREYLPVGLLKNKAVVSNGVFVIYNSQPYVFGLLASKIHMCWTLAVTGKLESRIRYSVNLSYNNFPFPKISERQRIDITRHVYNVLEEREKNSEKTISQMYDPDKMPDGLREAHIGLDSAIERCYRSKPFSSDEERLEYLFKLYEQMIKEEKQNKIKK